MLRKLFRRLGIPKTSALVTIIAVLFSTTISSLIEFIGRGFVSRENLLFAIAMPVVIAPIFNFLFLRLVFQLEDLQAQLREIAIKDELTQAYNRRHWLELAELELARAKRYGGIFSIIIFDIDNFKRINDTHGHLAGDSVLRQLSSICLAQLRKIDTFARYGGEEFIFLLPQADGSQTRIMAERIRQALSTTRFSCNQTEICITVSAGMTTSDPSISDLDSLLSRADRALYAAKRAEKNRAFAAEEPTTDLSTHVSCNASQHLESENR
jgi:diguanylate cyclase (GGDEF)-like protein